MTNLGAIRLGMQVRATDGVVGVVERLAGQQAGETSAPTSLLVLDEDGERFWLPITLVSAVVVAGGQASVLLQMGRAELIADRGSTAVRITAHGLALDPPPGRDARIRRHRHPAEASSTATTQFRAHPVLHAGDFALPVARGDFGSGATGRMPHGGAFFALKEYRPGPRLVPGRGLFAPAAPPLLLLGLSLRFALPPTSPYARNPCYQ